MEMEAPFDGLLGLYFSKKHGQGTSREKRSRSVRVAPSLIAFGRSFSLPFFDILQGI